VNVWVEGSMSFAADWSMPSPDQLPNLASATMKAHRSAAQ
jgi:hypothetical protein